MLQLEVRFDHSSQIPSAMIRSTAHFGELRGRPFGIVEMKSRRQDIYPCSLSFLERRQQGKTMASLAQVFGSKSMTWNFRGEVEHIA